MHTSETATVPTPDNEPAREAEVAALAVYRENLTRLLQAQEKRLPKVQARAVANVALLKKRFGDDPERLTQAMGIAHSAAHAIEETKDRLALSRLRQPDDIAYRNWTLENFGVAIREATPPGLPLRFHGAPVYTARDIIASGGISSSVDRLGVESSYDTAGQISVTSPNSIQVSLDGYTDLYRDDYFIPAGCLFVLLPATAEEVRAGEMGMSMENVDFREHPEQLVSILTTPENVEQVTAWTAAAGLDATTVMEFKEFPEHLKAQSQELLARGNNLEW